MARAARCFGIVGANYGGAPGNVLSMLTRLGHKTAFIGKVGNVIVVLAAQRGCGKICAIATKVQVITNNASIITFFATSIFIVL